MNTWRWKSMLAVTLLIGLVGCSGQGSAEMQALINQLQTSGATVVQASDGAEVPLTGTEQSIKVNGDVVDVYMYESPQQANADAAGIAPDGQQVSEGVGSDHITMKIPMAHSSLHFYKKGLLIVFYDGSNERVINFLQSALGSQIAGS
jgi:hypothetical protein